MNKAVGEIGITLGGKEWVLRPSFTALIEAEEISGRGQLEMYRDFLAEKQRAKDVLGIVYACLKEGLNEGEQIPTRKEVGHWIYEANILDVGHKAFTMVCHVISYGRKPVEKKASETTTPPTK